VACEGGKSQTIHHLPTSPIGILTLSPKTLADGVGDFEKQDWFL